MIYCLHGAFGNSSDWNFLNLNQNINKVNLWDKNSNLLFRSWAHSFNQSVNKDNNTSNTLIGYSMGGRLALHCLIDNPLLWNKAIIISSHLGLNSKEERNKREINDNLWLDKFNHVDWNSFLEEWNNQAVLKSSKSNSNLSYNKNMKASLSNWSLSRQEYLLDEINKLEIPILWITGEDDKKFSNIALKIDNKNIKHIIIPNAGHRIIYDKPEELNLLIKEFIKK